MMKVGAVGRWRPGKEEVMGEGTETPKVVDGEGEKCDVGLVHMWNGGL